MSDKQMGISEMISKFGSLNSYTKSSTNKNTRNISTSKPDIPMNYKILGFLLFFILAFGMYVFYMNPLNILYYAQVPFIIFYIIVIFCVLIFIERYTKNTNTEDSNTFSDLQIKFILFFKTYSIYLAIFLLFSFTGYYIYKYIQNGFVYLLDKSLLLTIVLVILVLSLFSNYSKSHTIDNPILDLIKDFIMYIPCLITDTIDYLKKDYNNTPSSVFIVFVILVIYSLTFYIIPMINKEMYKNDGILLIESPVYLNNNQTNITTSELRQKVFDNMPFYDRWLQSLLQEIYIKDVVDPSYNQISTSTQTSMVSSNMSSMMPSMIQSTFTEGFTSVMNQDTMVLTETYNSLSQIQRRIIDIITSKDEAISTNISKLQDKPTQLKEYLLSIIQNEPYLLTFTEKVLLIYASTLAGRDGILLTLSDFFRPLKSEPRIYRYSISLWLYLHKIENTKNKQNIITYGSLPSLYYSPIDSSLSLEYIEYNDSYKNGKNKILYKSDKVLYQRWNHIVITYHYGSVDLFINNNLIGTYKNITPFLYDDDLLNIGSKDNKNIGGICNVKYYTNPLTANKIETIYSQFKDKEPPI